MKPSVRRGLGLPVVFLASSALTYAHPGHDGHDLTWDFSHLAQYPVATIGCGIVLGAAVALALQVIRRRPVSRQSFRTSHANRGK